MAGIWETRLHNLARSSADVELMHARSIASALDALVNALDKAVPDDLDGLTKQAAHEAMRGVRTKATRLQQLLENTDKTVAAANQTRTTMANSAISSLESYPASMNPVQEAIVRGAVTGSTIMFGPLSFVVSDYTARSINNYLSNAREAEAQMHVKRIADRMDAIDFAGGSGTKSTDIPDNGGPNTGNSNGTSGDSYGKIPGSGMNPLNNTGPSGRFGDPYGPDTNPPRFEDPNYDPRLDPNHPDYDPRMDPRHPDYDPRLDPNHPDYDPDYDPDYRELYVGKPPVVETCWPPLPPPNWNNNPIGDPPLWHEPPTFGDNPPPRWTPDSPWGTGNPSPFGPGGPGGPIGSGGTPGMPTPGSGFGGGGGGGALVGGAGGGTALAGAKMMAGTRMGVGLAGGLGGAGTLGGAGGLGGAGAASSGAAGRGGMMGMMGGGAGGTGGSTGGAGGSRAGGRAGMGMMGGAGGAGSENDKRRRSGMSGMIAPSLDDDEAISARSRAADAGGRDVDLDI